MVDAGVKVFKIEGRARGPEYVKEAVECYDEALRSIVDGTYSEEKIGKDMYDNYYSVVKDIALYYWNKTGAEFEMSYSGNDVSRTYFSENEILGNVPAFVKIF